MSIALDNGQRLYADPRDERSVALQERGGSLNPPTMRMWQILIDERPWTHIVDVGANYGEMVVGVTLPPAAIVIAFEPNPFVLPYLRRTLREIGRPVRLVPQAVAESEGAAEVTIDRTWSGMTSAAGLREGSRNHVTEVRRVPATTLAAFMTRLGPLSAMSVLIKIDVEGFETSVLRGLMPVLGEFADFAALIEIYHLGLDDLGWIVSQFRIEVFDLASGLLVDKGVRSVPELKDLLDDPRYYRLDVVLRRRQA